ncbi:MAG: Xenobiotic-transporting ATPase [Candidatus Collierbacteria bacterium GW2011_GWB2_45_17]|uniref:Xenobiotic-transporting ATPase n=2 Tax=Candidatus Collieribacteriota TaxID=1752725 RepID=A0A0G1KP65_9BACT|nr:MAG: Xenobiotic-transporting ATPase [Microgenomates group bacterium GW2011_GWC1_44_23]KKT85275.1 MAG: Xenobiotic-transporting ATPase [Candidatus Collierbacteria bacterium GW2011_GWA2_44_99]KKT95579.1 MAG: Xenobiotic-transporting ATPase [Candidatus Collierbacteria bacterium GW2011_GWA1_45_15]KKU00521.1 MAG: Xenobiotic-transporting ATPase [Candidatus Collierbacteria bacterium GW2011_GWB2_45_17]KKU08234.1 MAG: Xenobiotic-transporting ATPase [Candidatus Collierbacteria bacterium GW2011_GWC2_45_4
MFKSSKSISSLKEFFVTYRATLKIAWDMDRSALIKITLANATKGALVYPTLLVSKMIIDSVVNTITTRDISNGLKIIIFATILGWLIDSFSGLLQEVDYVYSSSLPRLLSEKIQVNISRKINLLPVTTAENPEIRNLLQKVMSNSGRAVWSLVIPISTFPEIIFIIIATAIPIITFQPLLIIPSFILSIPNMLIGIKYSKEQHALSTSYAPKWRIWGALEDFSIKGKYLYENKILNHVSVLLNRRIKMATDFFNADKKINTSHAKRRQSVGIPLSLYQTGTRFYLYYLAITQVLTLGSAQITSSAIERFINNISRLIRQANDIFQNYLFIADYEKLMNIEEEDLLVGLPMPVTISRGIEFKDVWFKYDHSPNWILKGVSFKVDPKDNIAIVGENGAGKTTLIKLICRFYDPQKGEILLNGLNIKSYNIRDYRHQLSALFQDFAQYPFSVEDNIQFGDIDKNKSKLAIRKAAKLTGISDFVKSLPLKYKNPLDKEFAGGVEPSKGLWQRVALARILYRNAQILILDEPTSNVDPESEEQIFSDLLKVAKDKMIILVSHRFSTVRKADKILVLEKGVAVEHGSHHDLMKQNGRYKELFSLQAQSYQ